MAIYHFSVKPISRGDGRTATAAAAYRAAIKMTDERTGLEWDFKRKRGVIESQIVLPSNQNNSVWAKSRSTLWNSAEGAEKRKDACTAREMIAALPDELNDEQRLELVKKFTQSICDANGSAIDFAIHAPGKNGDHRNSHVHMMQTTRLITESGFGGKLEIEKSGRNRTADLENLRESWAIHVNAALIAAGHENVSVDHRSYAARGIKKEPGKHLGPQATAIKRRGKKSVKEQRDIDAIALEKEQRDLEAAEAKAIEKMERELHDLEQRKRTQDLQGKFQKHRSAAQEDSQRIVDETIKAAITINGVSLNAKTGTEPPLFRPWQAPNGDTVYMFKKPDSRGRKAAFSKRKNQIRVHAPDDENALIAAMRLAKEQWPGGITITGDRAFREAAEKEAERIGLHVQNKLQPPRPGNGPTSRVRP